MHATLKAALLVSALTLGACGDDGTGPDLSAAIIGTWDAQSIDGRTLPWTETHTSQGVTCTLSLNSLAVTFAADATYTATQDYRLECTGQTAIAETETFNGTYSINGNRITMVDADASAEPETSTFTISGSTLTMTNTFEGETSILVLKKR